MLSQSNFLSSQGKWLSVDKEKVVNVMHLDLSQAFDTVARMETAKIWPE